MNHRPKKRFGQNFLQDRHVVDGILNAASLESHDRVLEIGPGLGALTDRLLPEVARLHVIEIDRDLGASLQARPEANLSVHLGDALALDWDAILPEPPYKLIANLPYNISSQIVFKILDHRHLFSRLVLMFQQEVGERLCASPGGSGLRHFVGTQSGLVRYTSRAAGPAWGLLSSPQGALGRFMF